MIYYRVQAASADDIRRHLCNIRNKQGLIMAFKEEGSVAYTMINGKKVPVVKCETEVVLRNTRTNVEYNSDQEAEDDIADTNTPTLEMK